MYIQRDQRRPYYIGAFVWPSPSSVPARISFSVINAGQGFSVLACVNFRLTVFSHQRWLRCRNRSNPHSRRQEVLLHGGGFHQVCQRMCQRRVVSVDQWAGGLTRNRVFFGNVSRPDNHARVDVIKPIDVDDPTLSPYMTFRCFSQM